MFVDVCFICGPVHVMHMYIGIADWCAENMTIYEWAEDSFLI